jgi:hypothetical protein
MYVTDLSGPGSREWPADKTWLIFAALAVTFLGVWSALNRLTLRTQGRTPAWCLAGTVLGAGLVVMLSGYATGGQLGVPLAASLVGVALGSLVRREHPATDGALGVGVTGLFALLIVGRLFAGLTDLNAALLFFAPLLAWLPELLPLRIYARAALRLGLVAVPVVVAIVLAQQRFAADSAQSESDIEGAIDYTNFGK